MTNFFELLYLGTVVNVRQYNIYIYIINTEKHIAIILNINRLR